MKKFLFLFSFVFISSILFESVLSSLEARPGGGSSFRSSGSRSSGSSYRSSSSSSRSSGGTWFSSSSSRSSGSSSGSTGYGNSEFSKEGLNAVWCFLLIVVSMIVYFINVPVDFFKLSDWGLKSFLWTASGLIMGAMAANYLVKSGGFLMMFIIVLFVLPFIFIYYTFKNIFGTKETIYVAKKGRK